LLQRFDQGLVAMWSLPKRIEAELKIRSTTKGKAIC